jgi:Domain of unknown function (DUF6602)
MSTTKANLAQRVKYFEAVMSAKLELIREKYRHSGNKGSGVEQEVRAFLREWFPRTYQIGHGEVIDTNGLISGQLDVVVTNEHHPSIQEEAGAAQFMIEGVACAAEVKTTLTSDELRKAIVSCEKFKELTTLFKPEDTVSVCGPADLQRYVMKRPFFVFAMESDIVPDTLVRNLNEVYRDRELALQMDAVLVVDRCLVVNYRDGDGWLSREAGSTSAPLKGFKSYESNGDRSVLAGLLSWFSAVLVKVNMPSPLIQHYFPPKYHLGVDPKNG